MRALKLALAALAGLAVYTAVAQRPLALAMLSKASGGDQPCPWSALFKYPWAVVKFINAQNDVDKQLTVEREDPAFGIQLIRTKGRAFWIKKSDAVFGGKSTLAYVIAEQTGSRATPGRTMCSRAT